MLFKMCSISGKAYRGDRRTSDEAEGKTFPKKHPPDIVEDPTIHIVELDLPKTSQGDLDRVRGRKTPFGAYNDTDKFGDSDLLSDIQSATHNNNAAGSVLNHFFTVLSLCHTVLAETDPETGDIEYKAQSPDEAALVQAASDLGFVFLGRNRGILSIRTPRSAKIEQYELLEILEFTSARKRMSVLLRKIDTDELLLLTKGADDVIFERLLKNEAQENMKRETEVHLSEFAKSGLRTLTLAYRTVTSMFSFQCTAPMLIFCADSAHEYEAWSLRYQEATTALENREERMEVVASQLEQQLHLLGATAIEDRLQDGVPETIEDLKKAGIKIWVATGDKLETAIGKRPSTVL